MVSAFRQLYLPISTVDVKDQKIYDYSIKIFYIKLGLILVHIAHYSFWF